jgi:coatomer protein complex subunit epsilon
VLTASFTFSYVAQGRAQVVVDEIAPDTASTALQAVRLFARFSVATGEAAEAQVLDEVKRLLSNSVTASNPTLQVLAASMYESRGNFEDALRVAHGCRSLEGKAAMAQLYLRIDRPESAEKEWKGMTSSDEDATLTHLTAFKIHLYNGSAKRVQEALNIVDDLVERYGATPQLLNAAAVCNMHLGKWEEAETALKDAIQKDPNNQGALVNLALVCTQTAKHPLAQRYLAQLKTSTKLHPWIQAVDRAEKEFDEAAAH